MSMHTPWRIELLGWLRAVSEDRVLTRFRTQKTGGLLAYLAYYRHRSHPRESLIELFWPECDPSLGRQSLRKALSSLRHQLEPPDLSPGSILLTDRSMVQLNPAACDTDVAQFEAAVQAASGAPSPTEREQRLIEAAERYAGELLPGYYFDWMLLERQRLAETYLQVLGELTVHRETAGDLPGALAWARRAIAIDPLREDSRRDLMRLLAADGQPDAARRCQCELEQLLAGNLDGAPVAGPLCLSVASLALAPSPAVNPDAGKVPSAAPSQIGGRLPLQITRFFGRETEIEWLNRTLIGGTRLITLTGPGGSGKTRLALEFARALRQKTSQPDPTGSELVSNAVPAIWFVPLLDLSDPRLILDKVLDTLRLSRSPQIEPLEQIVSFLSRSPTLLILDNFEHLVEGGAECVQVLLEQVETLAILVTSRQRLDLSGERELPVAPLPVPEGVVSGGTTLPSVALFVDRAQAVKPDFQVTGRNATAIAALCRRLEGLPLALELAAARASVLTPVQMLARLERPFELLVGRQRQADARHRSLRATLDWSYQLLSPDLQRFFARLSVFRGGWTLEAAGAILDCGLPILDLESGADGSAIHNPKSAIQNALEYLEQLRGCSLVVAEPGQDEVRFRLLETLRQHAAEQLSPAERDAVAGRHLAYFRVLAEQAEAEFAGSLQAEWLARLDREHDNLRAALTWSQTEGGDLEQGLKLGAALWWFWHLRSYEREGWDWLSALLARAGGERTALRAKAQALAGFLALMLGDIEATRALSVESLSIGRELNDKVSIAFSLRNLGQVTKEFAAAHSLFEEGRATWQELGNKWGVAMSLNRLGHLALNQGDIATARALEEQSLAVRRELGDRQGIAASLGMLGHLAHLQGDPKSARLLCEEGLTIQRELGLPGGAVWLLRTLGQLAFDRNDFSEALALLEECLTIRRQQGNRHWIAAAQIQLASVALIQSDGSVARALLEESLAYGRESGSAQCIAASLYQLAEVARSQDDWRQAAALYRESLDIRRQVRAEQDTPASLEGLAAVCTSLGQAQRAARILGAARSLRMALVVPLPPRQQPEHDNQVASLRATLGASAFTAAWEAGQALSWEQAVAEALGEKTDR